MLFRLDQRVQFFGEKNFTGLAQVVAYALPGEKAGLPEETVLRVRGTVTANDQAPGGVEGQRARGNVRDRSKGCTEAITSRRGDPRREFQGFRLSCE